MSDENERKFLHDITNKMAIAQGMAKRIKKFLANPDGFDTEKFLSSLDKLEISIDQGIGLIEDRRQAVKSEE